MDELDIIQKMKRSITTMYLVVVVVCVIQAARADELTTLADMQAKVAASANVTMDMRSLARDWIGDVTDEAGKIERMRFEKGRIMNGEIALLRTYPNGSYLESDAPVYVKSIPINEMLRSCSTVAEIQGLIGTGLPRFSGWGGPNGMHSSHSWVCFSPTAEDRLTYIAVFAHTSTDQEQRKKGITQVNELLIQRGALWLAEIGNQKELDVYLSGADKFSAEKAEKARKRERYLQPLKDLILADEHPDDSNLKHLSAAIQAIRNSPDTKLFTQLVQELDEGTLKIRSLLNHILLNEQNILDLKAWGAREEAIAVGACIDSLPLAKDSARDELVETLLRICGGGKIEIEGNNGGTCIEIVLTENGHQMTHGEALNPLPLGEAQKELRRLYIKSRNAEQAGTGQPSARPEPNSQGGDKLQPEAEGRSR